MIHPRELQTIIPRKLELNLRVKFKDDKQHKIIMHQKHLRKINGFYNLYRGLTADQQWAR